MHGWYGHNDHLEQPSRSHQNTHDNSKNNSNQQYDNDEHLCNDKNNDNEVGEHFQKHNNDDSSEINGRAFSKHI